MVYAGRDGVPYWYVKADDLTDNHSFSQQFWEASASPSAVPVPIDQWFLMEVYLNRSTGADGRFLWAVNGKTIADRRGSNYGVDHSEIINMMYSNLYGVYFPQSRWVDDLEIWDAPPCGTLPCGASP